MLYSVKVKDKDAYIYQLFEHQSTADSLMPFRMINYQVQIMQMHLDKGYQKLPIVIPILYYHGKESPYPFSNCIYDLFEDVKLAKKYAFKNLELIDLTIMTDKELAKLNPELLFEYLLKHSRHNLIDHLTQWLIAHPSQSAYFLNASKKLLNQVLLYIESRDNVDQRSVKQLINVISQSTEGEFMTYLEKLEAKAIKRGLQQGIEKGIEQGVQQGIEQGIEKGIEKGIEQGAIKKTKEMAFKLLAMGLSVNQVIQATELEKSTILKIKKALNP
ncbi:Rpn family recombination-promoting nuclease/putative transposase [Thiotrichales bacterium 19S11-10]|nr:Rpn family recombination-promoting nuclease/putative transposase [Thiotrichales bacterium 19S11-10]